MFRWGLVRFTAVLLAGYLSACSNFQPPKLDANIGPDVKFIVIGDTPYSVVDEFMLAKAVSVIRGRNYPFIIHLGDYKSSKLKCTQKYDDRFASLISSLSPKPVFYTPGDNDWSDCDAHIDSNTGEPYSELKRLEIIRNRFFSTPVTGAEALNVKRQSPLAENQSWTHRNIRYFTLHVTGTNNSRDKIMGDPLPHALTETTKRDEANYKWAENNFSLARNENAQAVVITLHADITLRGKNPTEVMCSDVAKTKRNDCDAYSDLRKLITREVVIFDKPVLLIHGDTSAFTLDQHFADQDIRNLWRLNAAGDTKNLHSMRDVTEVSIDLSSEAPFKAKGLTSGIKPRHSQPKPKVKALLPTP